ncbi:MAG TPA: hypothetical protein VFB72_00280, partial [Verrucomicrobiae bacterium]|nr:hypothetical protein [Verrucomicrobiae bacterium]
MNEVVSSRAEIAGAGNAGLPDGSGVAPLVFGLPTNATVLTIQSVTGLITLNGGTGSNDADGVLVSGTYNTGLPNGNSYSGPYGGISGITNKGAGALVGVFEPAIAPTNPAPGTLDFTTIGTSFATLSPALDQVFFIGDGLTGDGTGTTQTFNVPAGAGRLVLGIADAGNFDGAPGAYGDNYGSFIVSFQVATAAPLPTTVTWVGGTGDWSVSSNWSTGALPGANDDVVIPAGPAITVTHSTGSDTVNSITCQQ